MLLGVNIDALSIANALNAKKALVAMAALN
jgi:hypothetical protein